MSALRTFLSIVPPPEIREAMRLLQEELKCSQADVRWERPAQFHATLRFLGDVASERMPELLARMREAGAGHAPFNATFHRLGAFPSTQFPRVIWIGCDGADGALLELKEHLDELLLRLGFPLEERPFHPHATLGRVRSGRRREHLTPMLEKCIFEPRNARVDRIFVMKSQLTPEGAEHSVIEAIQLEAS